MEKEVYSMKKSLIIIGILIVIAIGGITAYFYTQPSSEEKAYAEQLEKDVKAYLIENGYIESDIEKTTIIDNSSLTGLNRFEIGIEFTDEPDSLYYYKYNETGEIKQFGSSADGKHLEEPKE